MLNRRKVLLSLLAQRERPLPLTRANLLLSLMNLDVEKPLYQFIPTGTGPVSIDLLHDLRALEKTGKVTVGGEAIQLHEDATDPLPSALGQDEQELLLERLKQYGSKNEPALLDEIIGRKPFFAIRSERSDAAVEAIRKEILSAPRGLYTLGYEALSIDAFINHLIAANIQTVVDVREFAFSRRSEFTKSNLEEALALGGIAYIGMGEVGIPTKARREILAHKSKEELLEYYETEILPTTAEYAKTIAALVEVHNTALICHEEDPLLCHRSRFAAFALMKEPSISLVHDIRTKDTEGSGWW